MRQRKSVSLAVRKVVLQKGIEGINCKIRGLLAAVYGITDCDFLKPPPFMHFMKLNGNSSVSFLAMPVSQKDQSSVSHQFEDFGPATNSPKSCPPPTRACWEICNRAWPNIKCAPPTPEYVPNTWAAIYAGTSPQPIPP
jgi:hypothetical protein